MLHYLHIIWNPWIQASLNMFNVIKEWNFVPTKLNDFTVYTQHKTFNAHLNMYRFRCTLILRSAQLNMTDKRDFINMVIDTKSNNKKICCIM